MVAILNSELAVTILKYVSFTETDSFQVYHYWLGKGFKQPMPLWAHIMGSL